MTITLFDLTYRLASILGIVVEGTATGGTTTTTIDTTDRLEADGSWSGGTLWLLHDAAGAGAAPQGEFARITNSVQGTRTISHDALTTAPATGDLYGVARRKYPLWLLRQKVNEALHYLGNIPLVDVSSLTVGAAQTEYTLPLAAYDLRKVFVQTKDDTNDNAWSEIHDWRLQKGATGVASTLILPQLETGRKLKLVYVGPHPSLVVAADKLDENVPPERVLYEAAKRTFDWKIKKGDGSVAKFFNEYADAAEKAVLTHPILMPSRTSKLFIVR